MNKGRLYMLGIMHAEKVPHKDFGFVYCNSRNFYVLVELFRKEEDIKSYADRHYFIDTPVEYQFVHSIYRVVQEYPIEVRGFEYGRK